MTEELEKAKHILNHKACCVMERQADEARKRGDEIMDTDDIEFLMSINIEEKHFTFETDEEGIYDSEKLFEAVEHAKMLGFESVMVMCSTLGEDEDTYKAKGYLIRSTGWQSAVWDEIYFSEESYIKAEIASFQNYFGGIKDLVSILFSPVR